MKCTKMNRVQIQGGSVSFTL
ncbi:tetracycline resistance efflux system leader peptide [Aneurinibacillus migulanus]